MTNMKRICIIGDSHAAALKTGWTAIAAEYPGVEPTFFAARTELMESLEVAGNALVATPPLRKRFKLTSGGQAEIRNTYDAYAICGLRISCALAVQVQKAFEAKQKGGAASPESSTDDVLVKAIEDSLQMTMGIRMLDMVRQITDATAIVIPQPSRAEIDAPVSDSPVNPSKNMRWILPVFQTACVRLARQRKASFLPQPAETLSETSLATKATYARSPSRLDTEKTGEDRSHMNSEYGAIVLREALGNLANDPISDTLR